MRLKSVNGTQKEVANFRNHLLKKLQKLGDINFQMHLIKEHQIKIIFLGKILIKCNFN